MVLNVVVTRRLRMLSLHTLLRCVLMVPLFALCFQVSSHCWWRISVRNFSSHLTFVSKESKEPVLCIPVLGVKGVQVEEIYDLQSKCQR